MPTNANENFNYWHSQLRNVIERVFGMVKHHFVILRGCIPFPFDTQVKIVSTCFLLYNFIHREYKINFFGSLQDEVDENQEEDIQQELSNQLDEVQWTYGIILSQEQKKRLAVQNCLNMFNSMWH